MINSANKSAATILEVVLTPSSPPPILETAITTTHIGKGQQEKSPALLSELSLELWFWS
jgi:hypothetical protein